MMKRNAAARGVNVDRSQNLEIASVAESAREREVDEWGVVEWGEAARRRTCQRAALESAMCSLEVGTWT